MTKYDLYPHEFWLKVDQYQASHPALRYGQCVFNALNLYKPDHAHYIALTDLDPFYDDTRVSVLSEWLARHWLDEFE